MISEGSLCHANASCFNTFGSYGCECDHGFAGDGIDNCSSTITVLINSISNNISFMLSIDIDECADGSAQCDPNAMCVDTIGNYSCPCNQGYIANEDRCDGIVHDIFKYPSFILH